MKYPLAALAIPLASTILAALTNCGAARGHTIHRDIEITLER